MNHSTLLLALCLTLLPEGRAHAAEITSHVVSGGGGTASRGSIKLQGTLGQPVVGLSHSDRATLAVGFWNTTLQVVAEIESFETWMANLDPADQPPVDQRGPDDVPANDGMTNLLKYAFGLLPLAPSAHAQPELVTVEGDLALKFVRNPEAKVEYTLLASPDLKIWTSINILAEHTSTLDDGLEAIEMVTDHTSGTKLRHFFKLNVTKP